MSYGSRQYLGIEGDISNAQNGTKVVAVTSPFAWGVEDSDISGIQGMIRVLVHGTNFSLDLNGGDSADSTKVQLWEMWKGSNPIWAVSAIA